MRILIIYYARGNKTRSTINEHLYSFKKYSGEECHYLNVVYGSPWFITHIHFDLVIYHYTFTAVKWNVKEFQVFLRKNAKLKKLSGYKIATPQDEYIYSDAIGEFFREFGIKTVFTLAHETDFETLYPKEKTGLEHYFNVLPGYLDEEGIDKFSKYFKPHRDRKIDLGYRARKNPYWLGKFSLQKWEVTEKFMQVLHKYNLVADISNKEEDVFLGDDWYKFLGNCRVTLGTEGGASLHDPNGAIRYCVEKYMAANPKATFEETEQNCFPGLDGSLKYAAISPRFFQACLTKTCQAMVEGRYNGIAHPGKHYILIKKDWSNIDQVVQQIQDVEYCEQMAERTFKDIVLSGKYTYRKFVENVLNNVKQVASLKSKTGFKLKERVFLMLLELRLICPGLFSPFLYTRVELSNLVLFILRFTGINGTAFYKRMVIYIDR